MVDFVKPLVIIAARMNSHRLPGKALADLGGKTALAHVVTRVREANVGPVVVATTLEQDDDPIFYACRKLDVECFRGHDRDVLRRFYDCHRQYGGNPIVRVTADCPFLDPELLGKVARRIVKGGFDYVGVKGAPDGYHQEAFTAGALALADRLATDQRDREHVVTFMLARPAMFRLGWVYSRIEGEPVTLDTADDLERLRRLAA